MEIRAEEMGNYNIYSSQNVLITEKYPLSNTAFDHNFNGIVLSPDQKALYVNSGSSKLIS